MSDSHYNAFFTAASLGLFLYLKSNQKFTSEYQVHTDSLRQCQIYHLIEDMVSSKPTEETVKVLLLGGGLYLDYCSCEFLEICTLLANHKADITLVDHDKRVIDVTRQNQYYPIKSETDPHIHGWTLLHSKYLEQIKSAGKIEPNTPDKVLLPVPFPGHNINLICKDFSQIKFSPDTNDIVFAFNSIIYLFNNPEWRGPMVNNSFLPPLQYLHSILSSLKVGGKFFIDKTTYNLYLRNFKNFENISRDLPEIEVDETYKEAHIIVLTKKGSCL